MGTQRTIITQFGGGISANTKSGLAGSCRFSRNLNIYDDSDSVSLNPAATKESGAVVVDLVKWMVDAGPWDTNRYAYGDTGKIYKRTSGAVWSVDRSVSHGSAAGQGMEVMDDFLYYATSTGLGRKGPLSQTPAYVSTDDFVQDGVLNLDTDFITTSTHTGHNYTTPVAISEAAADQFAFSPLYEPYAYIGVQITTKGTGTVTITVHDSANNFIGSASLTTGNITAGAVNNFVFTNGVRMSLSQTYHIHITSTVADTVVDTGTDNSLVTINANAYFQTLVADTQWHQIFRFNNGETSIIAIANERYIAYWDKTNFFPNAIQIEPGFKIRCFTKDNEFLVAMAWRGTTIDGMEEGRAYYWDGVAPAYNYSKPITGGLPNAATNSKNRVFTITGSSGDMNLGTDPFRVIQPAPKLGVGKKVEVAPGGISNWRRKTVIGYAFSTDDSSFEQGIYEFGNQSDRAISYTAVSTEVVNFGYTISTGTTQSTSMAIGMVHGFGKDMFVGWKDGSSYGVDIISKTNNPAATGSWESLIMDDTADKGGNLISAPTKTKQAVKLVVTFAPLPTGCTVTPKYKIDRATNFTIGTAAVATATRIEQVIMLPYKEVEFGYNLTATVNYPTITSVYFEFDPKTEEESWFS